jgi:hypothetical protein
MGDDLKKKKKEDELKQNFLSLFLLNLGATIPGVGSAL